MSSSRSSPLYPESLIRMVSGRGEEKIRTGEIERDAERRAELIVSRVTLANRRVRVVDVGEDAGAAEFLGCVHSRSSGKPGKRSHEGEGKYKQGNS